VDQEAHARHNQDHNGRQWIKLKSPRHLKIGHAPVRERQRAATKPSEQVNRVQFLVLDRKKLIHKQGAQNEGKSDCGKRDGRDDPLAKLFPFSP
jgi:hypothetical protein